jgi:hypothetical protein
MGSQQVRGGQKPRNLARHRMVRIGTSQSETFARCPFLGRTLLALFMVGVLRSLLAVKTFFSHQVGFSQFEDFRSTFQLAPLLGDKSLNNVIAESDHVPI